MADDVEINGAIRDKLIARKEEWAREGRLLTGTAGDPQRDRLPPGQRLVRDWPVLDLGAEPNVTPQKFRLDLDGAVENRLSLTLDDFMALPQAESVSDIHCVTQWSRYDNHWKGVAARTAAGAGAPAAGGEARDLPRVRRLHDQHPAGPVRSARRLPGAPVGGQADQPPAWRAGADAGAAAVSVEVGEVAAADRVHASATIPASGSGAATTTTAIRGWRSATADPRAGEAALPKGPKGHAPRQLALGGAFVSSRLNLAFLRLVRRTYHPVAAVSTPLCEL